MKSNTLYLPYKGKCDICGEKIKPADSLGQYNRNMGLHKLRVHNIKSPKAAASAKYRANALKKKLRLEQLGREMEASAMSAGVPVAKQQEQPKPSPSVRLEMPPAPKTDGTMAVIYAPGVTLMFSIDYVPDVLHTLAFAVGGKRDWLTVTKA